VVRGEEGTDIFTQLGLEAAAGIRQPMATFVAQNASLRLIEERFMEIRQALGVSRTRTPEAIRFLSATIEELKASGFVRDALRGPGRSQPRSGRHVAQGWHLLDGGPLGG
jgi:polar amino acid transport system substrate-binding protein